MMLSSTSLARTHREQITVSIVLMCCLWAAFQVACAGAAEAGKSPFRLRGVYFHDGFAVEPPWHAPSHWGEAEWRKEIEWLHACGVNAVEFATMPEFNRIPTTEAERRRIADRRKILESAHRLGMQFGYILTNTIVSTTAADETPDRHGGRTAALCPRQPGNFEKTVALQKWYMEAYKDADFFEEFAADWGGCQCGQCGAAEYMRYVDALARELGKLNPKAKLYANTWCIAYWGKDPVPLGWRIVFDGEIAGTRDVIARMSAMPGNAHLALPCHHLYRPLAFLSYGGKAKTPEFPSRGDLALLQQSGREVLAWPHFVMDDDPGRALAWGIVHSEVRYIRDLLQTLRRVGVDAVVGNLYLPLLQISNTYAYGRLLEDPDQPADVVIRDFARLVAHPDDAEKLADVMTWVENNSYWEHLMPPDGRLPRLACRLDRRSARALAEAIRPNPRPSLPLPISPEVWLKDLRRSIDRMSWVEP